MLNLAIDLNEPATFTVDFSAFDSLWDPDLVQIVETDPANHIYQATYPLSAGTEIGDGHYAAAIEAADAAGNLLSAWSEEASLERANPEIVGTSPAASETVPFGGQLLIYFSEPMDPATTASAVSIAPAISGTLTWAGERILVFAPNIYFLPATTYTVTVGSGALDLAGNPLTPAAWSFHISSMEESLDLDVEVGWNLVAIPFDSIAGLETAGDLCAALEGAGAVPIEIDRWLAGGWDSHFCALPFNDFQLDVGSGYFARLSQAATWSTSGLPLQQGETVSLQAGWNLVGIPVGVSYTAESAGQEIIAQGGQCTEIDRWYAGGWDSHIIGLPFNDFALEPGRGYFVRCNTGHVWFMSP